MTFVLPEGMRRRIPRGSTYGMVPITTAEAVGDIREGLIRVPDGLTHTLPFTEKRRTFDKHVAAGVKKWAEWLAKQGWSLNSRPKVYGPYDPPSKDERSDPVDQGMKWYFVRAYFKRDYPLYLLRDADRWFQDEAIRYGESAQAPARISSHENVKPVKTILNPERVDPLKAAAERRERLGIKPDDWTQQPIAPAEGADKQVI